MDEAMRLALLMAIVRSRTWIDKIVKDPATDFGAIAKGEHLAQRHVSFLTPLAYLSPRIIEAIAEGRSPTNLTVTRPQPADGLVGPGKAARIRLIQGTALRSSAQYVRPASFSVLDCPLRQLRTGLCGTPTGLGQVHWQNRRSKIWG